MMRAHVHRRPPRGARCRPARRSATGNIATLAGARAPFFDWLETAHAEELLVMSNGSGIPRASEQSAALWALRIPEYLDTLDG